MGFDLNDLHYDEGDWTDRARQWAELGDAWGALIKDRFDKGELSG
jgi:hypothetical protein